MSVYGEDIFTFRFNERVSVRFSFCVMFRCG